MLFNIKNTTKLRSWWNALPPIWRIFFYKQGSRYSFEEAHLYDHSLEINAFEISENRLMDIYMLKKFELTFSYDTCLLSDIDLSPLTELPKLRTISLNQVQLASLEPIGKIKSLESFALSGPHEWVWASEPPFFPFEFNKSDITPLLKLPELSALYFFGNTGFLDINLEWIARMKNIHILTIANSEMTKIEDLSPLKKMFNLQYLDIVDTDVTLLKPLLSTPIELLWIDKEKIPSAELRLFMKEMPRCRLKMSRGHTLNTTT